MPPPIPSFAEVARRYLREGLGHLKQTTRADKAGHLRPGGPIDRPLGALPIDGIGKDVLRAWWAAEIESAGFVLEDEVDVGLKENYLLRFRRP